MISPRPWVKTHWSFCVVSPSYISSLNKKRKLGGNFSINKFTVQTKQNSKIGV